jgi:hypothetical protein
MLQRLHWCRRIETANGLECEGDPRRLGQGWVTTREDESQAVVADHILIQRLVRDPISLSRDHFVLALEIPRPPDPVHGLSAGRCRKPGGGIPRNLVCPCPKGNNARILKRILRKLQVAEVASETRNDKTVLLSEHGLNRVAGIPQQLSKVDKRADLDCSPIDSRNARCGFSGSIEIVDLDKVEATKLLLRFGKWPVSDCPFTVTDTHRRSAIDVEQSLDTTIDALAGDVLSELVITLVHCVELGRALFLLGRLVSVDEKCIFHRVSFVRGDVFRRPVTMTTNSDHGIRQASILAHCSMPHRRFAPYR